MNLDFPEHCLFCLGNIAQQDEQLNSNSSQELNCYSQNNSNHLVINSMTTFNCNFERLCKYLKIEFPIDTLKFRNVSRILSGEKRTCYEALLCGSCVEMVEGLHRMYEDLRRIQRRIDYGIKSVQSVMRSSDADVEEVDEEGKRKKRKLDRDSLGASSSVVADYLEFVDTFRNLVKEVETEEPKPVVLTGEADALAKCYEKLEEDLEMKNTNTVKSEEDETDNMAGNSTMQNEEGNGEDTMFQILSSVSVSMETNEDTNEGDDDELHLYSTDMDMFTGSEDNTMDSTSTPFGSTTSGEAEGDSFVDPLSPSAATSSSGPGRRFTVTFNCRYCDLVFNNPKTYYYHRKGMHAEDSKHLVIPSYHEDGPVSVSSKNVQIRTCPVCGETKKTKQNTLKHFMEHMLSHETTDNPPVTTVSQDISSADEDKPFVCDYCDQRFLLEMNLDLHKICYHESSLLVPLKCEDCGDTSSNSWEDLVTHLTEEHGGGEGSDIAIYSCKSCPMAFTIADQFLAHMQTHSLSKRLPCCECSCVSPSLKELYQHFNELHPDLITTLKCDVCDELFIMPNTYRKHFATVHATIIPNPTTSTITVPILTSPTTSIGPTSSSSVTNIQCPHCLEPRTFKNKLTLENHIRIHHDTTVNKHSCDQCGKAFVHRSTLRYHIQQVHLGIRYNCPHCPKSFTAKSLLKGHLKLHNGQGPPVINCQFCGKIFASQTALKTHTITQHGNNEPRACDVCSKEFQNIYSLRAHKSDVHNIKQWQCPHCTQQFARVKQFEKHLATHNLQLVAVDADDEVEFNE